MVYADKEAYAIKHNYATFILYAAANPSAPTELNLVEMIEEASEIINEKIGSFNTDITDTRFLSRIQKLCLRMVDRMRQIDLGQGLPGNIPMFSPNDFLIERERNFLRRIVGTHTSKRKVGGSTSG